MGWTNDYVPHVARQPSVHAVALESPAIILKVSGTALRCASLWMISAAFAAGIAVVLCAAPAPNDRAAIPEILVSRQLMERARLSPGGEVTLAADEQGSNAARYRIVGVYEPTPNPVKFSSERLEVRLHLPDLLSLTADPSDPSSAESISALNLKLKDGADGSGLSAAIAARIPGVYLRSTSGSNGEGRVFAVIDRFHLAIAIVTVVGSTAFLLALMVIRAEERRDIIGILRLIGIPARSILLEVLLEGLLIAVAGAVFGVGVAAVGESVVNAFFRWRYDTTLTFVHITPGIASQAVAFAVPLGVVAGLVASWTLLRRDVISLVRR